MSLSDELQKFHDDLKVETHRDAPLSIMKETAMMFPNIWRMIDEKRSLLLEDARSKHPKHTESLWDSGRCILPEAAIYDLLLSIAPDLKDKSHDMHRFALTHRLTAISAWRPSQDVIEIDPDVFSALLDTPCDKIPSEILSRLPAWSIYVPIPDSPSLSVTYAGQNIVGIFYFYSDLTGYLGSHHPNPFMNIMHVILDNAGLPKLTGAIVLDTTQGTMEDALLGPAKYTLKPEAYEQLMAERSRGELKGLKSQTELGSKLISILLYIISEFERLADSGQTPGDSLPVKPAAKKVKSGWRMFPPNKPHTIRLGFEVGQQIREGRQQERTYAAARKGPRPHIRRAHWHSFWTGRKVWGKGETPVPQKLVVKWLPPVPVALAEDEEPLSD